MDVTPEALVQAAVEARDRAYAPYSHYKVGAAVLTSDGRVFHGCNVENASYGLTVCAERVAIFSAVAAGSARIAALAVCATGGARMCGACRQVLREFGEELSVHLADESGRFRTCTLADLLPDSFGPEELA